MLWLRHRVYSSETIASAFNIKTVWPDLQLISSLFKTFYSVMCKSVLSPGIAINIFCEMNGRSD